MAHNNVKDSTAGSAAMPLGDSIDKDQNNVAANTEDQILVKALQDLIVRVVNPIQQNDMNQIHLGPEAGKLITALQEFISSIVVRSQSEAQDIVVEVSLAEAENETQEGDLSDNRKDVESPSEGDPVSESPFLDLTRDVTEFEQPQLPFEEKLLRTLREHVFNMMPIRLLCFEPHGSDLQIVLLERGAIYKRLTSVLQGKIREEEFHRRHLETDEKVIKRLISKYAGYAILSHTWLRTTPGEVTYGDWNKGLLDDKDSGYQKLVNFCKAVWKDHQLTFGWMDTVCINKESSSELDESIRSMYNWYHRADVCIVYLAETGTLLNMHMDPWFTRGWTLQELFAPSVIKFYNSHWKRLVNSNNGDDKTTKEIAKQIERATTISEKELHNIRETPISRKMQLAANREVTREEDIAYSLMGIFDISISTAYGEGAHRAFFRLLQEILVSSKHALDILNWAGDLPTSRPYNSRILPSSPKHYNNRSSNEDLVLWQSPIEPLTLTHKGLRVPVILMPGISIQDTTWTRHESIGDYGAIVDISPIEFYNSIPTTYNILDNRIYNGDNLQLENDCYQFTFAVFNFSGASNDIYLPKTCIAICLLYFEAMGKVSTSGVDVVDTIKTKEPIVFELMKRAINEEDSSTNFWHFKVDELVKHGMHLTSLYL